MGELRQLNEQNKLAIWAERVTECRNSGQSVLAWCKEHGICSQTYYKWQKRLFSVGKTAIVNVDPPPSPLQRKQGRPEILLTGPHLFPRIFFPASFSPRLLSDSSADQFFSEAEWTAFLNCSGVCPVIFLNTT